MSRSAIPTLTYPSAEFDTYLAGTQVTGAAAQVSVLCEIRELYQRVARGGLGEVEVISREIDGLADGISATVPPEILAAQAARVDETLAVTLREAYAAQLRVAEVSLSPDVEVAVREGVVTRLQHRPVRRVALYVPGGRERYPSTLVGLMASARAAGAAEITVLLPPDSEGLPDPACAWVLAEAGGATALCGNGPALIAGVALGVAGLPAADLIVGPGGPAVVAAQQIAAEYGVATGPAFGPTDCAVLAGPDANPDLLVADLLTESEHGHDPRLVLFAWGGAETAFGEALSRDPEGEEIWARNGTAVVCADEREALAAANLLGGEQIQLATDIDRATRLLDDVEGFASVLLGQSTSISAAYLTGAPGCLPTGRMARAISVVTAQTFRRTLVVGQVQEAAQGPLARLITPLATYEGFPRHGASQQIRS